MNEELTVWLNTKKTKVMIQNGHGKMYLGKISKSQLETLREVAPEDSIIYGVGNIYFKDYEKLKFKRVSFSEILKDGGD